MLNLKTLQTTTVYQTIYIVSDFENDFDKQELCKQFLAYNCKSFSSRDIPR